MVNHKTQFAAAGVSWGVSAGALAVPSDWVAGAAVLGRKKFCTPCTMFWIGFGCCCCCSELVAGRLNTEPTAFCTCWMMLGRVVDSASALALAAFGLKKFCTFWASCWTRLGAPVVGAGADSSWATSAPFSAAGAAAGVLDGRFST
uniref:Uncharacterized protein n=1 Tax=Anopheles melas TaxID=34690 RepID=A0A182TMY2_9DIPT